MPPTFVFASIIKQTFRSLCQIKKIESTRSRKMSASTNYHHILLKVFEKCVDSVKPKSLFNVNKCLQFVSPNIRVDSVSFDIDKKKCHLVGFGKAVLGMAVQVERILGDKLVSGMISVPIGTIEKFRKDEDMQFRKNSVVQVFEGAKNNLPDESAEKAARKIFKFVETLTENDVLFVLISGGGSALLSIPAAPITLNEKIDVIKMLTRRGADINELNSVRIEISSSKGGQLALAARGAHKVISLLISDICGDPIHLIASGPCVIQENRQGKAKEILEKYDLMNSIPQSVSKRISSQYTTHHLTSPNNSSIHVIGNNSLAIQVALEEMKKLNFRAICMSNHIEGDVQLLSSMYCDIAESVYGYASGRLNKTSLQNLIESFGKTLKFEKEFFVQLLDAVMDKTNINPICLVGGGEPTVNVKGNGVGGRNQELALRVANNIRKNETLRNIAFLSAGTDGMDGPCDAAGAWATFDIANDCNLYEIGGIDAYIENNDSYSFFKNLAAGKYHIVTGHTGTNVMDLHFMIIPLTSIK